MQELNETDFDQRIEFCETMMNNVCAIPNFLTNVIFSDESTFVLNGDVNHHNCRYFNDEHLRCYYETRTQYPGQVNASGERLIGPIFIDGFLNAEKYEKLLMKDIISNIENFLGPQFPQHLVSTRWSPTSFWISDTTNFK